MRRGGRFGGNRGVRGRGRLGGRRRSLLHNRFRLKRFLMKALL